MPSTLLLRTATALVAATTLAACSSGSAPAAVTTTVTAPAAGATPSAVSSADPAANGAASAGVDPANPPAVIASTTVPWPRSKDPEQTAKVELFGLRRSGKTLVLTGALTFTTSVTDDVSLYETAGNATWRPQLVDPVGLKLYRVVSWKGADVQADISNLRTPSGARVYLWAVFAAPPPGVTTLDVHFAAGVPPFTAVPVS